MKILKHILTFKMQLPVPAFMHGFLRRRVVSKYSLLAFLSTPCSCTGWALLYARTSCCWNLTPPCPHKSTAVWQGNRNFLIYPKLGIYSYSPRSWVVTVHFPWLLSGHSTSHLGGKKSLVEHLLQSSSQKCFTSCAVLGWLKEK